MIPREFPISRDPPEGGTRLLDVCTTEISPLFPISRDPPEGGTGKNRVLLVNTSNVSNF